jgi:hypothetical protein
MDRNERQKHVVHEAPAWYDLLPSADEPAKVVNERETIVEPRDVVLKCFNCSIIRPLRCRISGDLNLVCSPTQCIVHGICNIVVAVTEGGQNSFIAKQSLLIDRWGDPIVPGDPNDPAYPPWWLSASVRGLWRRLVHRFSRSYDKMK